MPAGPPICQLAASARRTVANDSSGAAWPTPAATELGNSLDSYLAMKRNMKSGPRTAITHLSQAAQAASWPTPTEGDAKSSGSRNLEGSKAHPGVSLTDAAMFGNSTTPRTAWPTPTKADGDGGHQMGVASSTGQTPDGRKINVSLAGVVKIAEAWSSPTARDRHTMAKVKRGAGSTAKGNEIIEPLIFQAAKIDGWRTPTSSEQQLYGQTDDGHRNLASQVQAWATPTEQDSSNTAGPSQWQRNSDPLNVEAVRHGMAPSGSPAQMARRGALNPAFPSWLMGYPPAWEGCLPSYSAWRKWQDWIESLSDEQKAIVWGLSEDSETP